MSNDTNDLDAIEGRRGDCTCRTCTNTVMPLVAEVRRLRERVAEAEAERDRLENERDAWLLERGFAALQQRVAELEGERDDATADCDAYEVVLEKTEQQLDRSLKRTAELEDVAHRAMNVIGGVWNGTVETIDESRQQASGVYHDLVALLDTPHFQEADR